FRAAFQAPKAPGSVRMVADEPPLAQIAIAGRSETDSDTRPGADGHRPPAQPAGTAGHDHAGNQPESSTGRDQRGGRGTHTGRSPATARAGTHLRSLRS